MTLGFPLGLLALAALPVVVGLYFLRRRQPPRMVSAVFLWASPDQRAEAGPRLERFSREASLALELLAILAATAFLADLRLGRPSAERHTVVVLDGSLSMSARLPEGGTVAQRALAALARVAAQDDGRVTVLESGLRPRILEGPASPRSSLAALRYLPAGPSHDLGPTLALAQELAGARGRVRVITDRPAQAEEAGDAEVIAVGAPLPNDGFVAAARVDREGKARIALRLAHLGPGRVELPVELRTEDGKVLFSERVPLGAGEERALRVELAYGGPLIAALPPDALPADDTLRLLAQPIRPLKVGLALPEGAAALALRRFLEADGAASLGEPADLSFAAPEAAAPKPWTVVLGTRGAARTLVGPFYADRRHPLLDAVPLEGLLWVAGESVPGAPLLTSGEGVLVAEQPGPVFQLNAALERSNLQRTAAWPVLLANLFALRREALPGFARRSAALDEGLVANVTADARWTLQGPPERGGVEQVLRGQGSLRLPPPGAPGRYRLLRDGQPADELEVLPLDRAESDLRERGAGVRPSALAVGRLAADRPRSTLPLALLALLLGLDWVVTGSRQSRVQSRQAQGRQAQGGGGPA